MNIGEAAKTSGVSTKMIRYYESIGLIGSALRTEAGYRVYSEAEVQSLRFIAQARDLGFSVEQMGSLLELWRDRERASADVKSLAIQHLQALEEKARAIQEMGRALRQLVDRCHGDDHPDCPIVDRFATAPTVRLQRRRPRFGATGTAPLQRHQDKSHHLHFGA